MRVISVLDADSAGTLCRLDDGETAVVAHSPSGPPSVGGEVLRTEAGFIAVPLSPSAPGLNLGRINGPAQVQANILSEFASPQENIKVSESESKPKGAGVPEQAPAPGE